MNLNELLNSFKIENKNQNARIIFQHNNYKFSTNAQSLLIKLNNACEELDKHSEIKINIDENFILETKKPSKPLMYHENEELWYIFINNELVDNNPWYNTEYLNFNQLTHVLTELRTQIETLYNLVEHKVFYSYDKTPYNGKLIFKTTNTDKYISYRVVPLENWGEVSDIISIVEMLSNYLNSKEQTTQNFECLIEGEPTLAVFDNYIYIKNSRLMIGYKPSPYFTDEQIADWHEYTNHELEDFLQTDGTVYEISSELYELLNANKESVIKHMSKSEKQQFIDCLENLSFAIKG